MSDWDNPLPGRSLALAPVPAHGAGRSFVSGANGSGPNGSDPNGSGADGLLDPFAFLRFLGRNFGRILLLAALLSVIGILIFRLIPFPYKATAIILVDPREKGVTVSEQVVTNVDGDAAVLESIVELVQSDGFVRPLLEKLDVASDPQFREAAENAAADDRKLLRAFKSGLKAFRLGATYIVEIAYSSDDPERSAIYANGVARAFIDDQRNTRETATINAANALSSRLSNLRDELQKSEKAVADFRTANNIVSVDSASTLQQRELTELSQQIALAKTNTEVARAQYEQAINSSAIFNTLGDPAETQQLQLLGQQRALISQNLAEFGLVYGARHPRIAAEQSKLASLDQQIAEERARLTALSKKRLDAALATQAALEADLTGKRGKAADTETALVRLGELEREARANREIYENFLSRFKSADEQQGLQSQQARLASAATAPLNSTRPSMALASGVIGLLSLMLSTALFLARDIARGDFSLFNRRDGAAASAMDEHERGDAVMHRPALALAKPISAPPAAQRTATQRPLSAKALPSALSDVYPTAFAPEYPLVEHASSHEDAGFESVTDLTREFTPRPRPSRKPSVVFDPPDRDPAPAPEQSKRLHRESPIAAALTTPVAGVAHIPRSNIANEADLERALARELAQHAGLIAAVDGMGHDGGGTVLLVSSWFPREGKTAIAQAFATLGAARAVDTILVKTPSNSQVERARGFSATSRERAYAILDPENESAAGAPLDLASFSALEAIVAECRRSFQLVVIDASHVSNERNFAHLSLLCDRTFIIFDKPDEDKISIIADKTIRANFRNAEIILNNL